ncbi:MAG: SPASM domain-containing protein [Cyclobacteriaceae bacterium]|nr:SPASM domain-containing protein [Cyclobacteriaceae bacterium]
MYVHWRDTLQLASKLNVIRIINAIKITLSYLISRITNQPGIQGLPMSISVEPTTACNLRCPECSSGLRSFTRPTGRISLGQFNQILAQLATHSTYLTFYFQGEPYLNPNFLEMVQRAHEKQLYTATSTNAHFLSDETARDTVKSGLNRLIISIDGISQESYSNYRKDGELNKVLTGTRLLVEWKKKLNSPTPVIIWQFLVTAGNEHEIPALHKLAKSYQVDKVALKTIQVYDHSRGNSLIPTQERYSRYRKLPDNTYQIKNKLLHHCWKMWSSCVITWDGQVVPCCFDKDASHPMGNLFSRPFAEIWNDIPYRNFRKELLTSRSSVEMCKNCSEGTRIWA